MARSLRIEYPGAVYHVINRGNYRQDLFKDEGTHWAFEQCLFEACERNGWVLEGFCVMTNHFHLILRTPMGNLSEGMRWLQSTFANRFNRHREETGRLFQGRFKSLVVEEAHYLGTLLDYVHLNPSRAGLVPVDRLFDYRWSSYYYFWNPQKRPGFLNVAGALQDTKGCDDTLLGRREYAGHLAWLMATPEAREDAGFNRLSRGWALGSKEFKRSLIEQLGEGGTPTSTNGRVHFEGTDLEEANQLWWEHCLQRCLAATDCSLADAADCLKSAEWKVLIAAVLKMKTSAPNSWISARLMMGVPSAVSRHVKLFLDRGTEERDQVAELTTRITE